MYACPLVWGIELQLSNSVNQPHLLGNCERQLAKHRPKGAEQNQTRIRKHEILKKWILDVGTRAAKDNLFGYISFINCSVSSLALSLIALCLLELWKEEVIIIEEVFCAFLSKIFCKWGEIFSTVPQWESFSAFCVMDYDHALLFKLKIKSTIDHPQSKLFIWPALFLHCL